MLHLWGISSLLQKRKKNQFLSRGKKAIIWRIQQRLSWEKKNKMEKKTNWPWTFMVQTGASSSRSRLRHLEILGFGEENLGGFFFDIERSMTSIFFGCLEEKEKWGGEGREKKSEILSLSICEAINYAYYLINEYPSTIYWLLLLLLLFLLLLLLLFLLFLLLLMDFCFWFTHPPPMYRTVLPPLFSFPSPSPVFHAIWEIEQCVCVLLWMSTSLCAHYSKISAFILFSLDCTVHRWSPFLHISVKSCKHFFKKMLQDVFARFLYSSGYF